MASPGSIDHSSSSSSNTRGPWLMSLLSFTAGAVSTSFLWYMTRQRHHHGHHRYYRSAGAAIKTGNLDEDEKNNNNNSEGDNASTSSSSPTFLRFPSMDDIKNRIGELPSSLTNGRKRWPWDRIRRSNSRDEEAAAATAAAAATLEAETAPFHDDSSNNNDGDDHNKDESSTTCIGSIFGLDVGGSLAKLVYFERKAEAAVASTATSTTTSPRNMEPPEQRRSRAAAAAQAVLMARRATDATTTTATTKDSTAATTSWIPEIFDEDEGEDDGSDYGHNMVDGEQRVPKKRRSHSFSAILKQQQSTSAKGHLRTGSISSAASRSAASSLSPTTRKKTKVIRASSWRNATATSSSLRHQQRHSKDSEADLRKLYDLRQESVPANLHAYAETYPTNVVQRGSSPTTTSNGGDIHESSPAAAAAAAAAAAQTGDGTTASSTNVTADKQQVPDEKVFPRAKSMLNLSMNRDHKEALDRFYNFARRLDSYRDGVRDDKLTFYSRELGGDFHFIHFETRRMQNAMDLIRAHNLHKNISKMGATGGGAHRFAKEWQNQLGVAMDKQEELDSLVAGMQFVLSTVAGECYTFRPPDKMPPSPNNDNPGENPDQADSAASATSSTQNDDDNNNSTPSNHTSSNHSGVSMGPRTHSSVSSGSYGNYIGMESDDSIGSSSSSEDEDDDSYIRRGRIDEWWWSRKVKRDAIASPSNTYPYLLVTIGTGVSILRVDGPRKHERISGSTIGGGTYWGLIRLLTSVERFEDVLRLAEHGDPSKVDMMVGDIYGSNPDALEKLGLPSNLVASSFGKLVAKEDPAEGLKEEDLARALLLMVTNNIGQVAYLNAQLYKTSRIYFVGNFLRQNRISQRRLSFAIDYWSKGEMEALFLEHEGYFGALGAFLLSQGIDNGKHGREDAAPTSVAAAAAEKRKIVLERQRSGTLAGFVHI